MSEEIVQVEYLGRVRFQSEDEARARRVRQGSAGRRLSKWGIGQARLLADGGPILDLACGNGRHLPELVDGTTSTVVGGDISEAMLISAGTNVGREVAASMLRLEAERLPFADCSFEVTFSARFFHHLPTPENRRRILAEILRVSRKGVIMTYKASFTYEHFQVSAKGNLGMNGGPRHRYFFREREIARIAGVHGWSVTKRRSLYGPFSANRVLVLEPTGIKNKWGNFPFIQSVSWREKCQKP